MILTTVFSAVVKVDGVDLLACVIVEGCLHGCQLLLVVVVVCGLRGGDRGVGGDSKAPMAEVSIKYGVY